MPNPVRKIIVSLKNDGSTVVHQMDQFDFVIGRSQETDFPFVNEEVSRKHLRVFVKQNAIYLRDLGSKNGTFVNGKRLPDNQDYLYIEGNPITLGRSQAIFKITAERVAEASPAAPAAELQTLGADEKTEKLHLPSIEEPTPEENSSPYANPQKSVGMIYDLDDSLELENSGLSEILGQEKKPEEPLAPKTTVLQPRASAEKSRTQIPSESPRSVRGDSPPTQNFNSTQPRPDMIRIHPKNKAGGYKSPSELVVEVAREVAHVIDKQFINIPEDKKLRKKAKES